MTTLLHIDSSIRSTGSVSRQLTAEFVSRWTAARPSATVVVRDLARDPVPHLTEQMMGAFFTPSDSRSPEQAKTVALSDALIDELLAADVIVIGVPMYNFSISSALKAWIDHVTRAGMTFRYSETSPVGLITGKKVYLFTASGGVYSEGPAQSMNFQETYLRAALGFIGLTDVTVVRSEGLAMGEPSVEVALTRGRRVIDELITA
ncbi:FMN-dependent NADH-azoreductase [Paraburkholderia sp. LEh10]|uniref:FMN-dependent NADH-azoreductase n=1 Tax=Paraburkholderia sp. LEh10 TaxID=2821353 RepID=UPI001AE76F29|nr:FMN-dependent NADH-azoreductase [Paraburkholderia sp. LEh10]MBP0593266.1 FMN-dependent NADH-azoreductase [Paraburkholderia sp. LEh10]